MAERAFFGPAHHSQDDVSTQQELRLYFAETDQLQHHPSSHILQPASSSSSPACPSATSAHAHTLSSFSHNACCPSSYAACSCSSDDAYHGHHHRPYDHQHQEDAQACTHHHQHAAYPHVIDELRTCARLKAELVAHPLFDSLLQAHAQCLSVGVSAQQMQAVEAQMANRHSVVIKYLMLGKSVDDESARASTLGFRTEIDVFMEIYLQVLLSWKKQLEELVIPPTIKALSTLCEVEQAFCDLTGVASIGISKETQIDEECEDVCLNLELEGGDYGVESQNDMDRSLFEHIRMELKTKLKESYRENIQTMREEIIRKRQAGKLPGDTTPLKKWWNAHSRWPYPTEEEKRKLAEETGLEMRQINNWFINHRKRNWIDRQQPLTSNAALSGPSSLQRAA